MATGGSDVASDEISDFQCFTCTNKTAVKYCVDCQGYCCKSCVDTHSRFPALKGHKLLDPSKAEEHASAFIMPTERCAIHTTKLVDMYCKDHDEVGCTTCIALNHRSCKDVHSVPDDINMLFDEGDLEGTSRCLEDSEKLLDSINQEKNQALVALHSSRKKADSIIDKTKQELIAHVEKLSKQSKEELEKKFQAVKAHIDKGRQEANGKKDCIRTLSMNLKASEGNMVQQFVCLKIANRKMKEARISELATKVHGGANISFDVDSRITDFFRDCKTFGNVTDIIETRNYTVETVKNMNVRLQDDKSKCYIFGSCWIANDILLLADFNNNKLKRVNIETKTVCDFCNVDNYPYCVCLTSKDEAVVTFGTNPKYIQFVSVGTKLKPTRKVNINHDCRVISCKDDKLYITDDNQTIYIHDMTGNELQKISTDSSGNSLFSCVRDINLSDSTRGIIVAYWDKGVIILNDQYQIIARYCDSDLKAATSVCTDDRGNIFVCGCRSHNVLQIGYDGSKIGCVVDRSHGIQYPCSVRFDSNRRRLIVTQRSDIVKVV